jgi:hypothetical protein
MMQPIHCESLYVYDPLRQHLKLRFFGKLLHDLAASLGVWKPGRYIKFLSLEGVTVAEIREKPSLG